MLTAVTYDIEPAPELSSFIAATLVGDQRDHELLRHRQADCDSWKCGQVMCPKLKEPTREAPGDIGWVECCEACIIFKGCLAPMPRSSGMIRAAPLCMRPAAVK